MKITSLRIAAIQLTFGALLATPLALSAPAAAVTDCSATPGPGVDLSGCDLSGRNLAGADLTSANLDGAILTSANLAGADLTSAVLSGAILTSANLTGAVLNGVTANDAIFTSAVLDHSNIVGANFQRAIFTNASLSYATDCLSYPIVGNDTSVCGPVYFVGANLTDADFDHAILNVSNFLDATITHTDFSDSTLFNVEFFNVSAQGAIFRNAKAVSNVTIVGSDVTGGDFTGITGSSWIFKSSILVNAQFDQSDFTGNFEKDTSDPAAPWYNRPTNLTGATFQNSVLSEFGQDSNSWPTSISYFTDATLANTNFTNASLCAVSARVQDILQIKRSSNTATITTVSQYPLATGMPVAIEGLTSTGTDLNDGTFVKEVLPNTALTIQTTLSDVPLTTGADATNGLITYGSSSVTVGITSVAITSKAATITTASAHAISAGDSMTISGLTGALSGLNTVGGGTVQVTSVPTIFSVSSEGADIPSTVVSAGTTQAVAWGVGIGQIAVAGNVATVTLENPYPWVSGQSIAISDLTGEAAFLNGTHTLTSVSADKLTITFAKTHADVAALSRYTGVMAPVAQIGSITRAEISGGEGTLTTLLEAKLTVGQLVTIAELPSRFASLNGNFIVTSIDPPNKKFTVAASGSVPGESVEDGKVKSPYQRGTGVCGGNFDSAHIGGSQFYGGNFTGMVGAEVQLNDSDFRSTTFCSTIDTTIDGRCIGRLENPNLSGADFRGANLTLVALYNPNLENALFAGATLSGTVIGPPGSSSGNRTGSFIYESRVAGVAATFYYFPPTTSACEPEVSVDFTSPFSDLELVGLGNDFDGFGNCQLVGVTIPEGIETIGGDAFSTAQLTSLVLPSSLVSLGDRVGFEAIMNQGTVTFLGPPPTFSIYGGFSMNGTGTMKVLYKSGVAGWSTFDMDAAITAQSFPPGTTLQPIYEVSFSANGATGSPAQSSVLQSEFGGTVTLSSQGTLARSGYTFSGWQTSGGTPVASPYTPTANITLVPRWSEIPGPTPEPTPASEPTSQPTSDPTTPTTTNNASSTQASPEPVPTELRPGRGTLVVDGQPVAVQVSPSSNARSLTISGAGVTLTVAAKDPDGRPIPLAPDGSLVLSRGGSVPITGSGFAPGSAVVLYLFSKPVELGEASANADGSISVSVPVPSNTSTGSHTIQVVGSNASGEPLALSVGLTVKTPAAARGARPVISVSQRTVSPGKHVTISVSGVQAQCLVRVSLPGSATTSRANGAGKVQAVVAAPVKPGKWEVRARVSGRGCDAVTVKTPISVTR